MRLYCSLASVYGEGARVRWSGCEDGQYGPRCGVLTFLYRYYNTTNALRVQKQNEKQKHTLRLLYRGILYISPVRSRRYQVYENHSEGLVIWRIVEAV